MTDNSDVSVVVRCFNEEVHLGRLFAKIQKQTIKRVEVVVVDSGSTDRSVEIAKSYGAKVLRIAPSKFSFGRSLNLGIRAASSKYVVIASAHVYPTSNKWIERMIEPLKNRGVALVYGKQQGAKTSKFAEKQVFKQWFGEKTIANQDHAFCNNANAAIKKSVWHKYKYNESLTGLEDLDWAKRIKQAGYQVWYRADAGVVHIHNETWRQIYNRYRREAIAFKQIFPEEKFGVRDLLRLLSQNIFYDWRQAYLQEVLWYNLVEIAMFRSCQFWGAFSGFRQTHAPNRKLRETFYYPRK